MVARKDVVKFLNQLFSEVNVPDFSYNGLQFEGKEEVTKIVAGVDATIQFFEEAHKRGGDFAFVHHGLFWKGAEWSRLDRYNIKIFKSLLATDLNLFAMHLPLDAHPEVGNNAVIAKLLDAEKVAPFGLCKGNPVGFIGRLKEPISIEELKERIEKKVAKINTHLNFGKKMVQNIGIVSGGGWNSVLDPAVYRGEVDVIFTGEIQHQGVPQYRDREIHLISAGHYATETFGANEVGKLLAKEFSLPYEFIDLPTGL